MIPISKPFLGDNELKYVTDCINSSWISSIGKYVTEFENKFANFCNCRYAISTMNGTVALHLALETLGIKPGDEVIVPSLTFIATANAVKYTGATPVFADSESDTWNIDPFRIEKLINKKTKAIIPVHLYGHPANMDYILKIAKKHDLYVIEDAAEAHGALWKNKKVGSMGDFGCFSFYGNKIITTGEGGMIVTNSKTLYDKAKLLKDHAMSPKKKYWHPCVGYNYRMTNVQAAIGVAQMEKIDDFIQKRILIASLYNKYLANINGITLPKQHSYAKNIYWIYTILIEKPYGIGRNYLSKILKSHGVDSRPMFYPIHTMPPYKKTFNLPISEELSKKGLSLPTFYLLSEKEIKKIANIIKNKS